MQPHWFPQRPPPSQHLPWALFAIAVVLIPVSVAFSLAIVAGHHERMATSAASARQCVADAGALMPIKIGQVGVLHWGKSKELPIFDFLLDLDVWDRACATEGDAGCSEVLHDHGKPVPAGARARVTEVGFDGVTVKVRVVDSTAVGLEGWVHIERLELP